MGMDVHGVGNEDAYFRNNAWWWRPLANYILEVAPEIAHHCKFWHSNDGDGLNGKRSLALAEKLQSLIDSGETEKYAQRYKSAIERLPNESCWLCAGTGTRKPAPEVGAGDLETGTKCNVCYGEGWVRPDIASYPFTTENVQEFVAFLRICKGFRIY